jgi:hypothetical protein
VSRPSSSGQARQPFCNIQKIYGRFSGGVANNHENSNAQHLDQEPVEWAKGHLEILIHAKPCRVKLWIKNVCDVQTLSAGNNPQEMDEFLHWHTWRAPKFIHMQPSGNTPYDDGSAWSREDQRRSENILDSLSARFHEHIIFDLERIAGEAYVRFAKEGSQNVQTPKEKTFAQAATTLQTPVAFISYSWDSENHKNWVIELASRLQREGVRIILDRWDLAPGGDKALFMEQSVTNSSFVILICTPPYAERANNRQGGVGYEATVITGELGESINQGKFIPVLRVGDWKLSTPVWIKTKFGVDLQDSPYSEEQYGDLLRALHREPRRPPPLGPKPIFDQTSTRDEQEPES